MNNKMALNTYPSTIESKKINKPAEQKQSHGYREHFDGCQMGGDLGGMGEKGEGIRKHRLVVTECSWGCKIQNREYSQ